MRVAILKRAVCVLFLVSLCAGFLGSVPGAFCSSRKVPLILVSEPPGSRSASGNNVWESTGFVSFLEKNGYRRGENLFVLTPEGPFRDLLDGAVFMREHVRESLANTQAKTVDIAAFGVSGLVLRYALEVGYLEDLTVRNLMMLASPQRGAFTACLLKSLCEIVKHEGILEEATRVFRFMPFGDVPSLEDDGLYDVNVLASDGEPAGVHTGAGWQDETSYLSSRARVYEPLYAMYVKERFLSVTYVPIDSPAETFYGWLSRKKPSLWEQRVVRGTTPPLGAWGGEGTAAGCVLPEPGRDLASAYYEILAIEIARNQYVMRMASRGNLIKDLLKEPYAPKDWKDALAHYGSKALLSYLKKALITIKAEIQEILADKLVRMTGYAEDPDAPFLRRLLKEDILVNLGTSLGNRFATIKVNHYLSRFNEDSLSRSPSRTTRYVSITGRVSNIWGLAWPQVGPNDWILEVDTAIAPLGPKDLVAVFSGYFSPSHLDLLRDKRVREYFLSVLEGSRGGEICCRPKGGRESRIPVSSWRPAYVELPPGVAGTEYDRLTFYLGVPPDGWGYLVWTEGTAGSDWEVKVGTEKVLRRGGPLTVALSPGERAGIRLVRLGPLNPYYPGGKVESCYEKEVTVEVPVILDVLETGETPGAGDTSKTSDHVVTEKAPESELEEKPGAQEPGMELSGNTGGPRSGGERPQGPVRPPGNDGAPGTPGTKREEIPPTGEIPTIRVVYRSKHTTLKKPEETYHSFWEMDFGDGDREIIQGLPSLQVRHSYAAPGIYRARAVSYDNRGQKILEKTWEITVTPESPGPFIFACSSISPPRVEVTLTGPKKWVTGKPAAFSVALRVDLPQEATLDKVEYDPGERFNVLWERAGDFEVACAVTLTITYRLEDKSISVKNTYLQTVPVTVLTGGVTR